MNKTKKPAELLGFVYAFSRLVYLSANTAMLTLSALVSDIFAVKMRLTAR